MKKGEGAVTLNSFLSIRGGIIMQHCSDARQARIFAMQAGLWNNKVNKIKINGIQKKV